MFFLGFKKKLNLNKKVFKILSIREKNDFLKKNWEKCIKQKKTLKLLLKMKKI